MYCRKSFPQKSDISTPKNRYSYCDPTSINGGDITPTVNFSILRSNSVDLTKNKQQQDIGRSKLSVITPSSPIQSPHYSLLVGETSSENSSALNTPVYEMEITSPHPVIMEGNNRDTDDDEFVGTDTKQNRDMMMRNYDTKDFNYIVTEDNCCNNVRINNYKLTQNIIKLISLIKFLFFILLILVNITIVT